MTYDASHSVDWNGLSLQVDEVKVGGVAQSISLTQFATITAGTVAASKAVVVDANKDIGTFRNVTLSGNLVSGSTTISEAELGLIDGVTAGTAIASKAVTTDASINVAALNVVGVARLDLDSETKTLSSNAVTTTKWSVVVTTESLSTAHTASQALVITKTGVAAGDLAMVSLVGGTNTGGIPLLKAVCTTDTVTVTISNMAKATDAFNGTFIFNLLIHKA